MWTFECDKKQTGKQTFQFYQNIVKIVTDLLFKTPWTQDVI